eukprot:6519186-Lingulodinium_polyedra.AAC.1
MPTATERPRSYGPSVEITGRPAGSSTDRGPRAAYHTERNASTNAANGSEINRPPPMFHTTDTTIEERTDDTAANGDG